MSHAREGLFRTLETCGLRRVAAVYLLVFLTAVAVAPHRHTNSLEDLISDHPSDSGVFLEGRGREDSNAGLQWTSGRYVDDDPCLACFHHDFDSTTEVIELIAVVPTAVLLSVAPRLEDFGTLETPSRPARSRAPPPLA